ncbi:MAG: type II toxin-antitoxin system VapC family toxin [Acidimicrobiia bacterium]|nr:type II toxin-antitoxin system VapC family toxin [Acidimicrobiia bacterium]
MCASISSWTSCGAREVEALLAVDSSAVIRRYVTDADRDLVMATMQDAPIWCASALVRPEVQATLHQLAFDRVQLDDLWRAFRADWDHMARVPVDDRCLARATELATAFRVRIGDAIHLAAADRLPRPVRFLTFDRRQISAASELGLDVVSPFA